jgi:tRNA(fMet)-specific endonuclease VapC
MKVMAQVRHPRGRITARIKDVGEQNICTSIVVAAELRYGAIKKASTRLTAQLETILQVIAALPLEQPADALYGVLRATLEQAGRSIGATLVTDSEREFLRIKDLRVENWLL